MATHRAQLHHRKRNGNAGLPRRTLAAGERQRSAWDDGCCGGRATSTVWHEATGDVTFVNDTVFGSLTLRTGSRATPTCSPCTSAAA
jgi:hypothetical protein